MLFSVKSALLLRYFNIICRKNAIEDLLPNFFLPTFVICYIKNRFAII